MSAIPPTSPAPGDDHADEPARTVLRDVRVFDGTGLGEPTTVAVEGSIISTDPGTRGARVIDGSGAVLLPGLIDAHIHLHGRDTLERLCSWGVTTGLDMATWPVEKLTPLRGVTGTTDIRSAGMPAIGPGGNHAHIPGMPSEAIQEDPARAPAFVAARVDEGADYIKIVVEAPGEGGPSQPVLDALVAAAHDHHKLVVAHAACVGAFRMALDAGADMLTHAPIDQVLDPTEIARIADCHVVAIPTLTMMEGTAASRPAASYTAARDSVAALHDAGVVILAGTDANAAPGVPFQVPHGESLHHEFELLVDAGLSSTEVLRAATSLPARHFGLADRGRIAPGLRADLVLIDGDPVSEIRATRNLRHVWCGGVHVVTG